MVSTAKLLPLFYRPHYQAMLCAGMMVVFTLVDLLMPQNNVLFEAHAGTWIVATAMIFCFVILNPIVAIRTEPVIPYLRNSIYSYLVLLVFAYGWCWLLTGKHIDEVGTFRWLWLVLTMVYIVFFSIGRSMKRIVDIAIRQDKKLRGEE